MIHRSCLPAFYLSLPCHSPRAFTPQQMSASAMALLAKTVLPTDVLTVSGIEDVKGVLKLVVTTLAKQEVSGVLLTTTWIKSFSLLWHVLVDKLKETDRAFLKRDLPLYSWLTWKEAMALVREHLSQADNDTLCILHAECISLIPVREVADAVRTLVTEDPRHFIDLINGDVFPITKGKVVLSTFWFRMGLVQWAAKASKKKLAWQPSATPTWAPTDGPSEKILERAIRDMWPCSSGIIPRDAAQPGSGSGSAADSDHAQQPTAQLSSGDKERDPLNWPEDAPPFEEAARLTMPQLLVKVSEVVRDIPAEYVKKSVEHLNTLLSPYPVTHRLGQQLLRLTAGDELSTCITSFAWPTGVDLPRIKCALLAWSRYLQDSDILSVTDTVKGQYLRDVLTAVREGTDHTTKWRALACQVAMDVLGIETNGLPSFQLETITDFPSLALALSAFISQVNSVQALKALLSIVQARCKRLSSQDWASAILQQMGVHRSGATPQQDAVNAHDPLPAAAGHPGPLVPLRMTLPSHVDGLPWPAFVAAASAFLRTAVQGPLRPEGLLHRGVQVPFCSVQAPSEAWLRAKGGLSVVQVHMGPGIVATLAEHHPDGSHVRPWPTPSLCISKAWAESLASPSMRKRGSPGGDAARQDNKRARRRSPSPPGLPLPRDVHFSHSRSPSLDPGYLPPSQQHQLHSRRSGNGARSPGPRGSPSPARSDRRSMSTPRGEPDSRERDRDEYVPQYGSEREYPRGSLPPSWEEAEASASFHESMRGARGPGYL